MISSIIHIAHEYFNGDEPWPIEIEDHDGVLHAVNLEPGQVSYLSALIVLLSYKSFISMNYLYNLMCSVADADI